MMGVEFLLFDSARLCLKTYHVSAEGRDHPFKARVVRVW
jgi:hypothetical protein